MNPIIIPVIGSMEAKIKHNGSKEWKLFARKITKNPFMKNVVANRHSNRCSWCNRSIRSEFILHHVDYDHQCMYGIETVISRPTEKRPNKKVIVPDCETCNKIRPEYFNECVNRLVPVHGKCNAVIEEYRKVGVIQNKLDF